MIIHRMDAGSLNTAEELVLGLGLVVTAWLGLAIARRLLDYAMSGGLVLVGLVAAVALVVYKPSRVYGWVEREASSRWTHTPSSEELVDEGIAALDWLRARLSETKGTVDDELYQRPASPTPSAPIGETRAIDAPDEPGSTPPRDEDRIEPEPKAASAGVVL